MRNTLKTHWVNEFTENTSPLDANVEELRIKGFTVLEDVVSPQELILMRDKLDAIYNQQIVEAGGESALRRINEYSVTRCPLVYDEYFMKWVNHERILPILNEVLGNYFIMISQNGNFNALGEEHYEVRWHRDIPYQHFVSSRPLMLSITVCLDEFTEQTGCTYVLPSTHKIEALPSEDYIEKHQIPAIARAGSVLVFDSMVFHRAGTNRSIPRRRALLMRYGMAFMKQQIVLPTALGGKHRSDPLLSRLLGYDSDPPGNPRTWREQRINGIVAAPK